MSERYDVIGPPGTGKTEYTKGQIERAAAKFGSSEVMACSLTRAAAAELRERTPTVQPHQVGTLHSFAFRGHDGAVVAETKLDEWNTAHPFLRLSPSKGKGRDADADNDGPSGEATLGDEMHTKMELLRHRLVPREAWPSGVASFANKWREWTSDSGYVDFTGMIESALELQEHAPGRPLAIFVDEAQDMSRLEVELVKKWGAGASVQVICGDPAQAINTFRGAEPEAFLGASDAAHRRVLSQSYRVPKKVHAAATKWGRSLLDGVEYRPTELEGEVRRSSASLRYAEGIVAEIERDLDQHTGTVMFQAQAGYMLRPVLAVLRQRGVPFHNPKRLHDGSWNPLLRKPKSTSTVDRVAAWLKKDQTLADVRAWLPMIRSKGVLVKGAKDRDLTAEHQIPDLFVSDDAMGAAFSGDPRWLAGNVTAEYTKRVAYPLAIYRRHGHSGLIETPRLAIGSIHSFKGAEADSVWLAPDLSPAAWAEFVSANEGSARRLFYVGMTRARHRLTILEPGGRRAPWLI